MWGKGPKDAKVMIIGESPSDLEDRTGKHFQGPSGRLLDQLLEAANLERKDCYLTYVVKCHTPEGRSPGAADVKACRPFLEEEITEVKPQFIVTLGATALKAVSKKAKVTEMHGQAQDFHGLTVFPTFSPAMALRDPARMPALRKDMTKLGHLMVGNVPKEGDLHWKVIRTLDDFNAFIEEFADTEEFAFDLETTGLDENAELHSLGKDAMMRERQPLSREEALQQYGPGGVNTLQIGLSNDRNYAIPLLVKDGPWKNKPKLQKHMVQTLVDLQAEHKLVAVGHNAKFDNRWLKKHYGVKFKLRFDTMLAHHIIDENSPHGLKEIAAEFCNAPSYDVPLRIKLGDWRNDTEREQFYKYGCFDVHYTLQLYYRFLRTLAADPSQRRLFFKLVMPAARMFEEIEEDGHYVNLKQQAVVRADLNRRLDDVTSRMNAMLRKAGVKQKVNWDSPTQIGKVFYKHMGMPVLEKTGKGAPSTAETVLLRLAETEPLAKLLMERRGLAKNLSTYVDGWIDLMHGDRLFLSTKLHGTVTGRFASRLHQVPRDPMIRSLIDGPEDEGWTFVSADYSQIELRIAAMLANDPRMKLIFQTGGDIHSETASFILGIPKEKLTKEQRKMAKAVNFGLLYGMGWPKLVIYARDNYGVDMNDHEAQQFRKRYFENYAQLPVWHERQRRCVRAFGQVTSLSGRIRHLPGINSSEKGIRAESERQGINSPVQGFGSGDMKAMAMVEIHNTISRDDLRIKGEVHDSILMWVRTKKLGLLLPKVRAIMESPSLFEDFGINMTVPIVADFEVGPWGLGLPAVFKGDTLTGFKGAEGKIITLNDWQKEHA